VREGGGDFLVGSLPSTHEGAWGGIEGKGEKYLYGAYSSQPKAASAEDFRKGSRDIIGSWKSNSARLLKNVSWGVGWS